MVQYSSDYNWLSFTSTDGQKISAYVLDTVRYSKLVTAYNTQTAAAQENAIALNQYTAALTQFQGAVNAGTGHEGAPPPKPQMKVVSDPDPVTLEVTVSYADFVPSLPDPVYPKTVPSGSIRAATPSPDRTDVVIGLLTQVLQKLDSLVKG